MPSEPRLDSFVLRFVSEPPAAGADTRPWRGLVRHIQSDAERGFTRWNEAEEFIARYVTLDPPHRRADG